MMKMRNGTGRFGKFMTRMTVFLCLICAGTVSVFAVQPQQKSFREDFNRLNQSIWYVSDGWASGGWQNCTWSKRQIGLKDGILTLGFATIPYKQRKNSCAEIQTRERFGYGTYEARIKSDAGSGLNAAFFTYIGGAHGQPHDEIDFEILTKDTSKVSLNTYVSGKPKNGRVVAVPAGTNTRFNIYSFVWEKDRIRWYVNGTLVHSTSRNTDLPTHPQKIYLSHWGSDTFRDWMGVFSDPGRPLTMRIDWVAYTAPGDACQFPESVACTQQ